MGCELEGAYAAASEPLKSILARAQKEERGAGESPHLLREHRGGREQAAVARGREVLLGNRRRGHP